MQVAAGMESVSAHAFHRDIHPRNMLVEERPGSLPRFGLVDFGLAVGASEWRTGQWRARGVAGDCRCWPPSAWVYFADGEEEVLDEKPPLRMEYEEYVECALLFQHRRCKLLVEIRVIRHRPRQRSMLLPSIFSHFQDSRI